MMLVQTSSTQLQVLSAAGCKQSKDDAGPCFPNAKIGVASSKHGIVTGRQARPTRNGNTEFLSSSLSLALA